MVTLHDEITEVLSGLNSRLSTAEIAEEVNRRGVYKRGDEKPVEANQIAARVSKYPSLFERDESKVWLKERK